MRWLVIKIPVRRLFVLFTKSCGQSTNEDENETNLCRLTGIFITNQYKKPATKTGANNVEKNVPIGANKKLIFEAINNSMQLNKNKGGAAVINRFKESKLFFWSVELLVVAMLLFTTSNSTDQKNNFDSLNRLITAAPPLFLFNCCCFIFNFLFAPIGTFFSTLFAPVLVAGFLYYLLNPVVNLLINWPEK
jgi:hypothetical protein